MKKLFYLINFILGILLPLFALNIIMSKSDPDHFFPLIFVCLGFCDTFLGINLLNSNKKILSASSFILAIFLFILVGSKVYIYN
jgi:heme/copper-type cytochrome/quinol oxidase subunit 4